MVLVATYWTESDGDSLKGMIPLSLWVLTTSYNSHLNLGVLQFPGGRTLPGIVFVVVVFLLVFFFFLYLE